MAEPNQITVESLSPTPVEPVVPQEEEQQAPAPEQIQIERPAAESPVEPVAEAPVEETAVQAPVEPAQQPTPAINPNELRPADPDTVLSQLAGALGTQTGPIEREGYVPVTGETPALDVVFPKPLQAELPVLLPKPVIERIKDGELGDAQKRNEAIKQMGDIYFRGMIATGIKEKDQARKDTINNAVGFGIPEIGPDGMPVLETEPGARTKYRYAAVIPFPAGADSLEARVTTMMEIAPNASGIFHIFDQNGPMDPITLDTFDTGTQGPAGRARMVQELQSPITAFFTRIESEEGGMQNYLDIMRQAGITDPTRQNYYLKQQAATSPLYGIESTRIGANISDMEYLVKSLAVGALEKQHDFTAAIPLYWYASLGGFANMFTGEKLPYDKVVEPAANEISKITRGQVDYYDYTTTAERLAEAAGVPASEAEALLGYSPDLLTFGTRTAVETVATGVPILSTSRLLADVESVKFADHVLTLARAKTKELGWNTPEWAMANLGKREIENVGDAVRVLEEAGLDSAKVLKDYAEAKGGGRLAKAYLADALDLDVQSRAMLPGPFRESYFAPRIKALDKKVAEYDEKIEAAIQANRTPAYIKTLREGRKQAQDKILDIKEKTFIPPTFLKYLKTEGIASTAAAVGYQAVYDTTGNDEFKASLGAMVSSVLIGSPWALGKLSATVEDIYIGLSLRTDPEALKNRKAAVKLRRNLEKSPPEIQEQVQAFMEHRMLAKEELSKFTFPEGHPRAGEQIISEDAFDQAFYRMSGLLALKDIRTSQLRPTINVQSDAGALSESLAEIEETLKQETALMGESAELFSQFKYLLLNNNLPDDSPLRDFATTYTQFYDRKVAELQENTSTINQILEDRNTFFNAYLTGKLETDEMTGLLIGKGVLADLIASDKARYIIQQYGGDVMPADRKTLNKADVLQGYHRELQKRLTAAAKANSKWRYDGNGETANANWSALLIANESEAYDLASLKFDAIRDNAEFKGARIDLTDIFDQMTAKDVEDRLVFDDQTLTLATEIGQQGTKESRALANLNLSQRTQKGVVRIFDNAAGEYMDALNDSGQFEATEIAEVLEAAGATNGSNIDQYLAIRNFLEQTKDSYPKEVWPRIQPKLGLDPTQFMHVVSGLGFEAGAKEGKRSAIAVSQLREQLLERGRTQFYDNFHSPTLRDNIEGFSEAYADARSFYKTRYIDPFRNMSRTIPKILRDEKTGRVNTKAFTAFMDEMGLGKEGVSIKQLQEALYPVIREITGGKPLDLSDPDGPAQQIRSIFTLYVAEEVARSAGAKRLQANLISRGSAYTGAYRSPLIVPQDALEIEAKLQSGIDTVTTNRIDNLLARDRDGNYLFADDNGVPLVDPRLVDEIGFEAGLRHDPRFRDAEIQVARGIQTESREILKNFKKVSTREGQQLEATKLLATRLGQTEHGIGKGFVDLALQEQGLSEIAKLKTAYIDQQVANGIDADLAAEAFETVKRERVIDYLTDTILKPGNNKADRVFDAETGDYRAVVARESVIDAPKLLQMLGYRGDKVEAGRQEKIVRELLGDEVWDHMRMLGNELFEFDPGTMSINVRGVSMPMSAESMLSRGTSFFRGVISARWLVSEAAIRASRMANLELTKLMLFDPKVGREIMEMVASGKYAVAKDKEPAWVRTLISQLAKNDALQRLALTEKESEEEQGSIPTLEQQVQSLIPEGA